MARWLIYALGGGWGHLTRAISLGRIAAQRHQVSILTNSHYASYIASHLAIENSSTIPNANLKPLQLVPIPPDSNFQTACKFVRDCISQPDCDCLIVDTFPRGLGGELADLLPAIARRIPLVLVQRDLNPAYIAAKDLVAFVARTFSTILIPQDSIASEFSHLPQAVPTAPWVLRGLNELPSLEQARALLNLPPNLGDCKTAVVLASGLPQERSQFGQLATSLAKAMPEVWVRCIAPTCPDTCHSSLWISHWPAIECLPAADLVLGAGGYNTLSECHLLGLPLVAFAQQRLYDRQFLRLRKWGERCAIASDIETAIDAVAERLSLPFSSNRKKVVPNGAIEAVDIIVERTLSRKKRTTASGVENH